MSVLTFLPVSALEVNIVKKTASKTKQKRAGNEPEIRNGGKQSAKIEPRGKKKQEILEKLGTPKSFNSNVLQP